MYKHLKIVPKYSMCVNILTFTVYCHRSRDRWYSNPRLVVKVIAADTPDLQHDLPLRPTPAV